MSVKIKTRKCSICKKDINLNTEKEKFFMEQSTTKDGKTKRTFKHKKCFIKYETEKKRNKKSLEECNAYILKNESNYQIFEKTELEKENLFNFIFETYDVSFLSTRFYIKMASVFDGSMTNISKPIPASDLLDMWERKKDWLQRVSENNRKRGKEIEGEQRVLYDLAILIGKYDSYLKWKEQKKLAQIEKEQCKHSQIDYSVISKTPKNNNRQNVETDIDILSLIDSI